MGQGHLSRPDRRGAAADQADGADRVVRGAERPAGGGARPSRPQALAIRATSSASTGASGGRIDGSLLAASDLPAPGGPTISRLCPPAAATSSACRRCGCPRRSARSGAPGGASRRSGSGSGGAGRQVARRPAPAGCRALDRDHLDPLDQRRLGAVLGRHARSPPPRSPAPPRHRQRPLHRPGRAVERQLPDQGHPRQPLPLELVGGARAGRRRSPGPSPAPPCAGWPAPG